VDLYRSPSVERHTHLVPLSPRKQPAIPPEAQKAFFDAADRVAGMVLAAGWGTAENALFFAGRGRRSEPFSLPASSALRVGILVQPDERLR
jgi:hypothetical protein